MLWLNLDFILKRYVLHEEFQNYQQIKYSYDSSHLHCRAGSITSAAKSLDILRQNLQKYINREIDDIVQRYLTVSNKWPPSCVVFRRGLRPLWASLITGAAFRAAHRK